MANSEYYTSNEFKQTPEYKEMTAEVYAKPREMRDDIPENAPTPPETSFGTTEGRDFQRKNPLRKKARSIFDTLHRSITRLTGSLAGTVAVGAAAVALTVGMISPFWGEAPTEYGATLTPLPLSEAVVLADDGRFAVFLPDVFEAGENDKFLYTVTAFDDSGEKIAAYSGQNENALMICDEAPAYLEYKEQYKHGRTEKTYTTHKSESSYTPHTGVGSIHVESSTVRWGEMQNEISLPLHYQSQSEALFYRLLLKGEGGDVLSTYEGTDSLPKITLPPETNVYAVVMQYLYQGEGGPHLLYEKELSGRLYLKSPVIELLDKKLVGNEYLIAYRVTSENAGREEYQELRFYEAIQDIEIIEENVPIGHIRYLSVPMDSAFGEIDLSATLYLNGAYGGNERSVTVAKTYQNRPELSHRVLFDLQYSSIDFTFHYFAPADSYVLLTDKLTNTAERVTDTHSIPISLDSYHFTYQLMSPEDLPLSEELEVRYTTPEAIPDYEMHYPNPVEHVQTWNGDGTVNLYAETGFACDDPNVFYEIEYSGAYPYVLRSREPLAKMEGLPEDQYAIVYRVFYAVDGVEYLLYTVSPSGTTGELMQVNFNAGSQYGAPALILGAQGEPQGTIEVTVNGKELLLTREDFTKGSSELYYCFEEEILTLSVKLIAEPVNDNIAAMREKYGEGAIRGSHFYTVLYEFK